MKRIETYIFLILSILAVLSCRERHPALFDDITGVYFNNRTATNVLMDSTSLTFVYEMDDEMQVPVRVQLLGRPSAQDRVVDISVSSDDAEEGRDYILPQEVVLPAGAVYFDYILTLKRTEALKLKQKLICLEIHANEYFDLPLTEIKQAAGVVTTLKYRIFFSDMFTEAPTAWDDEILGTFSQQKFELICDVLNINPADFNDYSKMTLAKQFYIVTEMTAYIKAEVEKKNRGEDYDENIIDRETGEPVSFS